MEHQTILFCDAEVSPFVTSDRGSALLPRDELISFDVQIESFEVWTAQFRASC